MTTFDLQHAAMAILDATAAEKHVLLILALRADKSTADQLLWKRDRIGPHDVARCNYGLKHWGSTFRFTPDGFPYDMTPGEADPAPATFPWRDE